MLERFYLKNHNKTGLALCAIYLLLTGLCLWAAYSAGADFKGQFVMLQLPIALQLGLLDFVGFGALTHNLSWLTGYLILVPLTLLFLYSVGIFLTYLWMRAKWVIFIILLIIIIFFFEAV